MSEIYDHGTYQRAAKESTNPAGMMMLSRRVYSAAMDAGVRKRISKSWDFDLVGTDRIKMQSVSFLFNVVASPLALTEGGVSCPAEACFSPKSKRGEAISCDLLKFYLRVTRPFNQMPAAV